MYIMSNSSKQLSLLTFFKTSSENMKKEIKQIPEVPSFSGVYTPEMAKKKMKYTDSIKPKDQLKSSDIDDKNFIFDDSKCLDTNKKNEKQENIKDRYFEKTMEKLQNIDNNEKDAYNTKNNKSSKIINLLLSQINENSGNSEKIVSNYNYTDKTFHSFNSSRKILKINSTEKIKNLCNDTKSGRSSNNESDSSRNDSSRNDSSSSTESSSSNNESSNNESSNNESSSNNNNNQSISISDNNACNINHHNNSSEIYQSFFTRINSINEIAICDVDWWKNELGDSWYYALEKELQQPYLKKCIDLVMKDRVIKTIFPPASLVFNAFRKTPLEKIKAVVVGQDPYHQHGQTMGLCFSVPRGMTIPPSLRNVFKEIDGVCNKSHGDLSSWADQGVFLLNSLLTVVEGKPMSHKDFGWEKFTDKVIDTINIKTQKIVFLLWGKPAQKKACMVDKKKHFILEAGHPSPLSVRFFSGCEHFKKCNQILKKLGKKEIQWFSP